MTFRFNYWIIALKGDKEVACCIFVYSFLKEGETERQVIEELELLGKTLPTAKLSL